MPFNVTIIAVYWESLTRFSKVVGLKLEKLSVKTEKLVVKPEKLSVRMEKLAVKLEKLSVKTEKLAVKASDTEYCLPFSYGLSPGG